MVQAMSERSGALITVRHALEQGREVYAVPGNAGSRAGRAGNLLIKQGAKLGVVSGVTTNPSLMAKEGNADYEAVVKEICTIIPGPVSAEVVVEGAEAMIEEARKIAAWAPNVVIKIPATAEGLEVTSALAREKIKVNFTLCFCLLYTSPSPRD